MLQGAPSPTWGSFLSHKKPRQTLGPAGVKECMMRQEDGDEVGCHRPAEDDSARAEGASVRL